MSTKYINYARILIDNNNSADDKALSGDEPLEFMQAIAHLQLATSKYFSVKWPWEPYTVDDASYVAIYKLTDRWDLPGSIFVAEYSGIRRTKEGYTLMYLSGQGEEGHTGTFNRFEDALKIFAAGIVSPLRHGHVEWMWQGLPGSEVTTTLLTERNQYWNKTKFELRDNPEAWFIHRTDPGGALSHCLALSFDEWVDTICQYPPVNINEVLWPKMLARRENKA